VTTDSPHTTAHPTCSQSFAHLNANGYIHHVIQAEAARSRSEDPAEGRRFSTRADGPMEQPRFDPTPPRTPNLGLVQLLRLLGDCEFEHCQLANTIDIFEFVKPPACNPRAALLTDSSHGAFGSAGHVDYSHQQTHRRRLFDPHCLDWTKVAHRIHSSEQVFVGNEGKFHPANATDSAELHMECECAII
jgi:hypothetical protein